MNRDTPEDLVNDLIHRGKSLACDEDGFVTLTDKEGNSYVAQTNKEERDRYESTGKPLSKVKKEKTEKAGKSEGKKETKETEKKSAEVVELHPEKSKKYKVAPYGRVQEMSKEEVNKTIKDIKDTISKHEGYIQEYDDDIKKSQKELDNANKMIKFWKDYKAQGSELSPGEFLRNNKAKYNITSKSDLRDIDDDRLDADRVEAKIASEERRRGDAQNDIDICKSEQKSLREGINEYQSKIKGLEKTLAQDSALEKYFDNLF